MIEKNQYKKILVIPSNRPNYFESFFSRWFLKKDWDHVILIEDNPTKTINNDCLLNFDNYSHYSWKEIDEILGENSWIISRRDSAIRSFGFLMAKRLGAEYILTLDDDCYPYNDVPLFDSHIQYMNSYHKWTESIPGMRTRGLPYKNLGKLNVVANMGLWSKIPDLDAVQSLNEKDNFNYKNFEPPKGNRIIPPGQYSPLCAMNYCFHASMIPLSYFPIMGENSPYRRFDDIWHGIIFKKIIDHLGLYISVGEPFIEHQRASDIFVNLVKEAPGIKTNEWFWEIIDKINLKSNTPETCMKEIGAALEINTDDYISKLGRAIEIWIHEVEKII